MMININFTKPQLNMLLSALSYSMAESIGGASKEETKLFNKIRDKAIESGTCTENQFKEFWRS